MSGETVGTIKDVLYVRFSVTDLQVQQQFLENFGLKSEISNGLLIARGTDASPYIYIAEHSSEPAFVSVGFAAESEAALRHIAATDGVPVEANDLPGGGLIARLTDPNGFSVEVVANLADAPLLTPASRSGLNDGVEKLRLGERVTFVDADSLIKRLGHVVLMVP